MCSIAGIVQLKDQSDSSMSRKLEVMNDLQSHRGPDGEGIWVHDNRTVGFAHRRLSIIDITGGKQPMGDKNNNWLCFNGEIYNYLELMQEIGGQWNTKSDTEVILKAYEKWGEDCINHFKGMFSFALWDEKNQKIFCARDRFGIKPLYYAIVDKTFYFASEMKALLPFLQDIKTDIEGFKDYLTFQFCLEGKTLFDGIKELQPAHKLVIKQGNFKIERYWQIYYHLDWDHTDKYFIDKLETLLKNSVRYHIKSDVSIGGYVSGGVDSSAISSIASKMVANGDYMGFTGKFSEGQEYDESRYAQELADTCHFPLQQIDITHHDFMENIEKVIYHLDTPIAGPGSFCQYMTSKLASKHRKVVLGGQGGDEIFGGYVRYLIAYFEQCIKGAINGTMNSGKFIVTYESIIPNLVSLQNYKPMLKEFWKEGLFDSGEKRYFQLINRSPAILDCVNQEVLNDYSPYNAYEHIFRAENVKDVSYFDSMTHFDFKTLLPALLQVEDRMSMAHGVESRVPLLDHELVEFSATIPSNFKLKDGDMKHIFKIVADPYLTENIRNRKDKMGFPIPLNSWIKNELKDYVYDIFTSKRAMSRELIDNKMVLDKIATENKFGRNIWGMLSLELWQREFHDKAEQFQKRARF